MGISDRFRSPGIDPTAVIGRRIISWLLDNLFMAIVVLLVHRGDVAFNSDDGLSINPSVIWTVTVLMVLNHVALTMSTGFSVGKAVTGLRVVRRIDGGLPGFRGAAGRTLPWIIPVPFIPVIEAGMMLANAPDASTRPRISHSRSCGMSMGINNPSCVSTTGCRIAIAEYSRTRPNKQPRAAMNMASIRNMAPM